MKSLLLASDGIIYSYDVEAVEIEDGGYALGAHVIDEDAFDDVVYVSDIACYDMYGDAETYVWDDYNGLYGLSYQLADYLHCHGYLSYSCEFDIYWTTNCEYDDVYDSREYFAEYAPTAYLDCETDYRYCENLNGWCYDCYYCDDDGYYYSREYCESEMYWYDGAYHLEEKDSDVIADYHELSGGWMFKHYFKPRGNASGRARYYGIELEVDNVRDNVGTVARNVLAILNRDDDIFHAEHDGSLDNGFELVSQPMTLELWNAYYDTMSEALAYLRTCAESHNAGTCGLHVHINSDDLSETQIDRAVYLLECFKDEIFKFSRRRYFDNSYASFITLRAGADLMTVSKEKKYVCGHCYYYNLAGVYKESNGTFEVRAFRGTLLTDTLYSAIDLCAGIFEEGIYSDTVSWYTLVNTDRARAYSLTRCIESDKVITFDDHDYITDAVLSAIDGMDVLYDGECWRIDYMKKAGVLVLVPTDGRAVKPLGWHMTMIDIDDFITRLGGVI